MVIKQDKCDRCINGFLKFITGGIHKADRLPPPPKYKYEPPERYLLPSELATKKKIAKRNPIKTLALTKDGVQAYRKPYRCMRPCVHPETGTVRYQEYFCYPPLECEPMKFHPPVGRPVECTCKKCDDTCEKGCGCVPACKRAREVNAQTRHLQAPCDLEPVTVCIPVPPRKPPERVCTTCVLELRVDEDFNVLNDKQVRKHVRKHDIKFQVDKKKFEAEEVKRLRKIGRLCPTLHMDPRDMPKKIVKRDGFFRIVHKKGDFELSFVRKKKLESLKKLFKKKLKEKKQKEAKEAKSLKKMQKKKAKKKKED